MTIDQRHIIPEETVDKIKDLAVLHDVIQCFVELKKKGKDLQGNCPYCNSKNFSVSPGKSIYKCWSGCGTEGNNAIKFLMDVQGMTFLDAIRWLGKHYNVPIEEKQTKRKPKTHNRRMKFRDAQLRDSGISDQAQKYYLKKDDNTKIEADRYQAASVDKAFNVIPGDDLVLHYVDLDGQPLTYQDHKGRRKVLIRVRWANPDLHLSKDGEPMKYQSPYKSGSHLWLPQGVIKAYASNEIIETLYITEGEKKADRMTIDGMMTVGIMGIHNFSNSEMPRQFEQIIKRCGVKKVVFVLDSDWQDISMKESKPVDLRPKTFYRAVSKFRDYFYAFSGNGIYLDIFFAYGKDAVHKGMDDLLVRGIEEGDDLGKDFQDAIISREGVGKYVDVHKITDISAYQLKQYWNLHSPAAFMKAHEEDLKKLRDFQFNKLKWKWDDEEKQFQLAQKIMPHEQFWDFVEDRNGNAKPYYIYQNMRVFLNNRGYGQYEYEFDHYRFVQVEGKVVQETSPSHIRRYVRDFVEDIGEKDVLEMILRGGNAYMGSDKLADLYLKQLEFMQGDRDSMYLFFNDQYWHITAEEIRSRPLNDMPSYVWQNNIIDFRPERFATPMLSAERTNNEWSLNLNKEAANCDMFKFYANTSWFHWKKTHRLVEKEGRKRWVKIKGPEPTDEEVKLQMDHLMAKICSTGYIMHDFLDYSLMKAIICMDGNESEVGRSEGGTGKSIFSNQFEHVLPIEVIDGKSKTIEDDKHLYELVDERTRVITFDDVRVNFNFEWLFSQITRGITVNPKGVTRRRLTPPKFIINTNHAINGDSNSFRRRQYMVGFADYYNGFRTPYDEFGYQLFHDWDYQEWNRYYNFLATCMQYFLRYRLDFEVPGEALERRRLRQQIGESFIEWASLVFDQEEHHGEPTGIYLNKKIERNYLYQKYLEAFPEDKRYTTSRIFKEKLEKYCNYAGLMYNPTRDGGRIKSNGKEYFIIGARNFNAASMGTTPIHSDMDIRMDSSNAF